MLRSAHIFAMVIALFMSGESQAAGPSESLTNVAEPAAAGVLMAAGGAMTLRRPVRFRSEGGDPA